MTCGEVRDLLPEHALGTLETDDARRVDRHLAWCAGCRKEARMLAEGAAAIPLVTEGIEPPPSLATRVNAAVDAAVRHRPSRRGRIALVAAVVLALASIGLAGAMAGRMQGLEETAREATDRADRAASEFQAVLAEVGGEDVLTAPLTPTHRGTGGGRAMVYDSAGSNDFALVIVGGLPRSGEPYWATIRADGGAVGVGRLIASEDGQRSRHRFFTGPVEGYRRITVTDSRGRVVLRGKFVPAS